MHHFVHHTNSNKELRTLLVYDNNESHLSIEVPELAKNNGVTLLTFPLHSMSKLQLLDVGVCKPFKTFYNITVDNWLMQHPSKIFSIYNIAGCVNAEHQKAMTPATLQQSSVQRKFSFMIEAFLQKQTFSVALLLTDLVKCYKNKNHWQHMKQVKNRSL
jgi:hypothetical protein